MTSSDIIRHQPAKGAAREYHLRQGSCGLWSANYYVVNAETGAAWQGVKNDARLVGTHHRTFTYAEGTYTTVFGPLTEGRFSWDTAPVGTKGASIGYLTREALVAAITG